MPAEFKAELKGLIEAQRGLEQTVRDLRGGPFLQAMQQATLLVQRDARKGVTVDRGLLRASITPEIRSTTTGIEGIIGSNLKYAAGVELGTKPHWAPLSAILGWVHRKGFGGTFSVKTRRRQGTLMSQTLPPKARRRIHFCYRR
jgi:hypothetical protein